MKAVIEWKEKEQVFFIRFYRHDGMPVDCYIVEQLTLQPIYKIY